MEYSIYKGCTGTLFQLHLPEKVIRKAKEKGLLPDEYYVSEFLERTGILTVPGSAFGLPEGHHRLR